VTVWKPI